MKRNLLLSLVLVVAAMMVTANVNAQGSWRDKLTWTFKIQKIDNNHAYIVGTAKLIEGWHIFSVNHDPMKADFTGYPTGFKFNSTDNYKLVGKLQEFRFTLKGQYLSSRKLRS
jgi:hypothetical protein